ncbi:MAG TPA: methyltransferase domain-containing protein [Anaeromyxobacter sp.]
MSTTPESPNPLGQPLAWDLVADGYMEELVPVFERFAVRALDLASVGPGTRVLDVAAGPGTLALVAAERGAEVTAVDFSPGMIERLRGRAAANGVATVRAVVGDGQALELPDAAFDAAFSMFGVIFFPDRARGLREMTRVLATGGRAVVSSWPPLDRAPILATVFGSLRAHLPGFPLAGGRPPLGDPAEIRAELGAAGLNDVQVEEVTVAHEFASMHDAWTSIARSTAPLALLRRRLGADASRELEGKILQDLVARFGSGPVPFDAVAYLASGRRAH